MNLGNCLWNLCEANHSVQEWGMVPGKWWDLSDREMLDEGDMWSPTC